MLVDASSEASATKNLSDPANKWNRFYWMLFDAKRGALSSIIKPLKGSADAKNKIKLLCEAILRNRSVVDDVKIKARAIKAAMDQANKIEGLKAKAKAKDKEIRANKHKLYAQFQWSQGFVPPSASPVDSSGSWREKLPQSSLKPVGKGKAVHSTGLSIALPPDAKSVTATYASFAATKNQTVAEKGDDDGKFNALVFRNYTDIVYYC